MTTVPLVSAKNLNVWLRPHGHAPLHVVRDLDFDIARGERVGLVGESGCGKTTTILALMGLLPSSASVSGSIRLNGAELLTGGEEPFRRHRWTEMSMVFQSSMNALNPVRSIRQQLAEAVRREDGMGRSDCGGRIAELLEMVGLPARRADQYPHELSGGMRQRVCLAMALACKPSVLLADEPTTALDVMVQAQVLSLLRRLSDDLGLALLLVTHDIPSVGQVCQRGAVMYAGRLVEDSPIDDLYDRPLHPYTAALFAATPHIEDTHAVTGIPGTPLPLTSEHIGCPFAPRCTVAMDVCTHLLPPLEDLGGRRAAACHAVSGRAKEKPAHV